MPRSSVLTSENWSLFLCSNKSSCWLSGLMVFGIASSDVKAGRLSPSLENHLQGSDNGHRACQPVLNTSAFFKILAE